MPSLPLAIGIIVYDPSSNLLEGATVTLTKGSDVLTGTSNSSGEVILNLGDLSSWAEGDSATLYASKTGEGELSQSITLPSSPTNYTMYLAETSDYNYDKHDTNNLVLQGALLTTYDGRKATFANPIPVLESSLPKAEANPSYSFTRDGSGYVTTISTWAKQ